MRNPTPPPIAPRDPAASASSVSLLATMLLLVVANGCSGGGGGGGNNNAVAVPSPPVLVLAAFSGPGASPIAGNQLILGFNEDLLLASRITDLDVELSGGGSLGSVLQDAVLSDPRTVAITLGVGVSFVPGATTITFTDENDAVFDLAGEPAGPGTPITITAGDGDQPTISELTVNALPASLNGTGPAGGVCQVPPNGFTIDVTATDPTSAIDYDATILTANVAVVADGTSRPADTNLTPFLTNNAGSFTVPATVTFPNGDVTLSARAVDATGFGSTTTTFDFRVTTFSTTSQPFESGQLWFIDTSRDLEDYSIGMGGSTLPCSVIPGANGTPDYEDLLRELGVLSATDALSTNASVLSLLRTAMLAELATLFDGVSTSFTFTSPGVFPGVSVPYASGTFSQISLAGAATADGNSFILGSALFDTNNRFQDNNTLSDFNGSRLGVFMYTLVALNYETGSPATLFQTTYRPFTLGASGTPIGDDAGDPNRLADIVNDTRSIQIDNAIARFARAAAVVIAHECGHSIGLVANGAMPTGLYGNDATNFPLSGGQPASNANGHIENQAIYAATATNVMAPSFNFTQLQNSQTSFNPLNRSYLQERVIYFQ
jgi:hypothetical protein